MVTTMTMSKKNGQVLLEIDVSVQKLSKTMVLTNDPLKVLTFNYNMTEKITSL